MCIWTQNLHTQHKLKRTKKDVKDFIEDGVTDNDDDMN